uniref:Tyrosine-protein kinase ephrin type A/B receptor-like domain-containing protein n=1 Tax=Tetradesmus obliquus TaxID=3088 RepID=A0A383W8R7_TETOB|eukprot:jgi/Sobl393_1/2032/SZX73404.1
MSSVETYVCLRCRAGYVPVKGSDGKSVVQCVCPPGTFLNGTAASAPLARSCVPCTVGSYCPGGNPKARTPTDNIGGAANSCNIGTSTGLTTKSARSTRRADCIAQAGYVLPATAGGEAQECTGSTYAPAFNRLRTCLPCQSGLAAPDGYTGAHDNKLDVCQVPPGKFWELNVVRDCPKGLYREEFVRTDNKTSIACLSCPEGWTTQNIGTPRRSLCNVLLPGYQVIGADNATSVNGNPLNTTADDFNPPATQFCPVGYYADGTAGFACVRCPYQATTLKNGSTSADDCVVPPGYFAKDTHGGVLEQCPTTPANPATRAEAEGYYRPGWKSYKEVLSTTADGKDKCIPCGSDIRSRAMDADEMPGKSDTDKAPASSASCYILAGWGITFDPSDFTKFRAIAPCPNNTYGVANTTYGLINAPCKACTKNLYSLEGSTNFTACLNPGGFGYTSEGANQCPDGFWAAKDSMAPCEQCPPGRTTLYQPGNGAFQDSIEDCIVPPGSGIYNGNDTNPWSPTDPTNPNTPAKECPIGFYSSNDTLATDNKCKACPDNGSTTAPGSTSCTVCAAGYGIATGETKCSACPYGKFNLGTSESCNTCPQTTFNDFVGDGYLSNGITFKKNLKGPESCVPIHAQLPKPVGDRFGLPDAMFTDTVDVSTAGDDKAKVAACVTACPANQCCIAEIEKSDSGITCKQARLAPLGASTADNKARMYYKLPPSEIAAATKNTTTSAKTMASGIYAICDIEAHKAAAAAGELGTSPDPTKVEAGRNSIEFGTNACKNAETCKAACAADAACWGFIYVPGSGFALRGGESWLGGRSFFGSPNGADLGALATSTVETW